MLPRSHKSLWKLRSSQNAACRCGNDPETRGDAGEAEAALCRGSLLSKWNTQLNENWKLSLPLLAPSEAALRRGSLLSKWNTQLNENWPTARQREGGALFAYVFVYFFMYLF